MYYLDQRLEPREELLWEGTRVYGVVTCSFAKPTSPTIIACETEEKLGSYRVIQNRVFLRKCCAFIRTTVTYSTYCAPRS